MVVKKKSKGHIVHVDFTGVSASGALPEDNYEVKVEDVTQEEGPKAPYLNFELKVSSGKYKGKKVWHICTLSPDGLFNLRGVLEALGVETPESAMDIDIRELKGLTMGISTEIEVYKKKPRTRVVDVFSLEEGSGEESEEAAEDSGEESKEEEGGEESGESEAAPDLEDMNLKELLAYAKEKKIKLTEKQKLSASRVRVAIEEATEE